MIALGLDLSFSSTTADWWMRRSADGYKAMSQCLWTGGFAGNAGITKVARQNLEFARLGFFQYRSGYINAAPQDWWSDQVAIDNAKINAGTEWDKTPIMWVDWEIPTTPTWRVVDLGLALEAEGKRVGVYTRRSIILADPDPRLARWPLWIADFDGNPSFEPPVPPFTRVIGKQYEDSHDVEGVTIDTDSFDLSFWPGQGGFLMALTDDEQEELLTKTRELWERFVGWTILPDQLTPQHHLGPEDAPFVGMNTRDELLVRMRDIDHGR